MINYCHHTCADCTCMGHYDSCAAIAVHSAYYLGERDFLKLHQTFGPTEIAAVVHRPTETMLPKHKPEFSFIPATEFIGTSWYERARMRAREALYGEKAVAMVPLASAGTVYVHDSMEWLAAGGRHSSPITRGVDDVTRSGLLAVFLYVFLTLLIAMGCVGGVHATTSQALTYYRVWTHRAWVTRQLGCIEWIQHLPLGGATYGAAHAGLYRLTAPRLPSPTLGTLLFTFSVTFGLAAVFLRWLVWPAKHPGLFTDMTLTVTHGRVLADAQGEAIADLFVLRTGEPRDLAPIIFGDCYIEPLAFNMAFAIFSSTNVEANPDQVEGRVRAAVLRRYGYNVSSTVASTRAALAAYRRHNATSSGNGPMRSTLRQPNNVAFWPLRPFVWVYRIIFGCIRGLVSCIRNRPFVTSLIMVMCLQTLLGLAGVLPDS